MYRIKPRHKKGADSAVPPLVSFIYASTGGHLTWNGFKMS